MYIYVGIFILLTILLAYTLYKSLAFKKSINRIITGLDEILDGNSNRRFLAREQISIIKNLVFKLNKLMEAYQSIVLQNKHAEEVRKRMISDISHDIRTPLTSIQGYMEVLQKDKTLSNEEREEYIAIVVTKCHSLNNLVQSFFEISRLDEADTTISLAQTDINASVRMAMSYFYNDFEKEDIKPEINLPPSPSFAYANTNALDRVLQNLISNTLYYGREGKFFGISVEEDRDKIWVNIWDKGKGIMPDELKYIFERSYNVRTSSEGKNHVSGLGLAIAKKLIEKQNGEIIVNSIPDERTVFSFSLKKFL